MRLNVTVLHVPTGHRADRSVVVDPDHTVDAVARHLASSLGHPRQTSTAEPGIITVDGVPVDPTARLSSGVLLDGAVLGLGGPATHLRLPQDLPTIRIIGGRGAGTIHVVDVGLVHLGSSPDAGVRLDGPRVPPIVATIELDGAGRFALTPTADAFVESDDGARGPLVLVDRVPVRGTVTVDEHRLITIGDILLTVAPSGQPSAATTVSDGGGTLDHARPPRLLPERPTTTFRFPAEPQQATKRPLPIVAALAPMLMAVVMVTVFGNVAFLAFGLMSPVVMMGNHLYDKRNGKVSHRQRLADHQATKEAVAADAESAVRQLQRELRHLSPDAATVLDIAARRRSRLWERRRDDPDHLRVRIGTADLPSGVTIEDPAELEHRRTVARPAVDVPVTVGLADHGVVGVAGRSEHARPLVAWMLAQLAVVQSPRDVRFVVLTEQAAAVEWSWLAHVPHARPDAGRPSMVRLGNDAETVARRIAELGAEIDARQRAVRESRGTLRATTDIVLVVDGARRLRTLPGLVRVLREGPAVGVYAVCVDSERRSLPEECVAVVTSGVTTHSLDVHRTADVREVKADLLPPGWFEAVARAVAPLVDVHDGGGTGGLPARSRLLDVLQLEPPTPEAVLDRWARTGATTEVVIGESLDGPFSFDLRRDGPHGLVAGTTGSGKSELLQSMVASLAAANTPESMTFVLVDYKGGAAFRDFAPLPHTVGMVTDLDTHLVERALRSLGAELRRREHLLAAVGAKDLEDYVDGAGGDAARPPLPRLLIVIDEFASMVRELPDFVTGLVDIAQRGRSLGIHLVLATQRPTGVVTGDIRANTNLRIALRVTDAGESSDVIDAGDAAGISKSTPGRAFVRLGASALVPFQAGRVGGRRAGVVAAVVPEVWSSPLEWSDLGRAAAAPPPRASADRAGRTDLVELVGALTEASTRLGISPPHRPWLDALPEQIVLDDDVAPTGHDRGRCAVGDLPVVPFGRQDFPAEQRQAAAALDLQTLGHLFVVGAPRSGRSQALRTIAAALADRTSCGDVHLFGIDCGSGALLPLESLPHVGAVVQRTQHDRVRRLLAKLVDETHRRQQMLAATGHASVVEQRRAVPEAERLPHLLVMIDRWEGFTGSFAEIEHGKLVEQVALMLREGAAVGVHVIVTGDRQLVAGRLASFVDDKVLLRLTDRADYALAGLNPRTLPDTLPPGRGFTAESSVETQIALIDVDPSGHAQAEALRRRGARATRRDRDVPVGRRPFRVDQLGGPVSFDEAWCRRGAGDPAIVFALIGLGGDDLVPMGPDLADGPGSYVVTGPPKSGRSTVLTAVVRSLTAQGIGVVVVTPRRSPLRALDGAPGVVAVITTRIVEEAHLAPFFAGQDGPRVLVIDDGEHLKDCPAADWLAEFVRACPDSGRALVVAGTTGEVLAGWAGWQVDVRNNRCGAVLSPQLPNEGDQVGLRLAKSDLADRPTPGFALVDDGSGQAVRVQVPFDRAG
ncbi:FtsK/SpoIIIE domain-containing protein [Frigoribacterium sp. PhB24]|uniref:FtsK/SpoIIIE domain-containing protein n=1 Tax=Frigoribacterium sp. PhB24 TaxID=2485204 RepID=UPI000F4AA90F|nr:FtsK/SpoIIIE domain-containing protein [Frigoribacterium sp. PhB24]ROS50497.1 S-DNA-T family DNA segregation ATPase FtsK/SpoIIIE [Frigoribacterium sp. PhB24]